MPHSTPISTIGGTILALITIPSTTIVSTIIIASIGAITSFFVSLALRKIWNKVTKQK
jgi:hypothetical protein